MARRTRMGDPEVIICRDLADLSARAAERFLALTGKAVNATGRFAVALSGGSTPKGLYALLATSPCRERVPWHGVHFFWGDERCVLPDHRESNYRMVREVLLSKIPIPAENVHRMAGEKEPQIAAAEYEEEIKTVFGLSSGALPRFDLILLGLGEDGHTASLFPGSDALRETERLVVACYVRQLGAYRLTLTLPVLNAAAHITFLVAGQSKAAVVKQILQGNSELPAAKVKAAKGRLLWLLTQEAAASARLFQS